MRSVDLLWGLDFLWFWFRILFAILAPLLTLAGVATCIVLLARTRKLAGVEHPSLLARKRRRLWSALAAQPLWLVLADLLGPDIGWGMLML